MLFAGGGRWDIAAAAWIYPVLLLRFSRLSRAWSGTLWVWLANIAATVNRIWERPAWRSGVACTAVLLTVVLGGGARLALAPPTSATVRIAGVSPSPAVTEGEQAALNRITGRSRGRRRGTGIAGGTPHDHRGERPARLHPA